MTRPAVPAASRATRGTMVRHGIREGELFAVYYTVGGVPRDGYLARWRSSPDNPRMFELVEEEGGASMRLGYSSRLWAVKLEARRYLEGSR